MQQSFEYNEREQQLDEESKVSLLRSDDKLDDLGARSRKQRRWILSCSLATNAVLFISILFLLSNPCYFSSRSCAYRRHERGLELLGELNHIVPKFSHEKVVFMNDSRYSNEQMFSDQGTFQKILRTWEDDMPLGRGFVVVSNSSQYNLSRPWHLSDVEGDGYSIASLHQFHCLYMIMRAHGEYRFGHASHDPDNERHVTHCFDYLRQSAQCAGDATLEGKSATTHDVTDGWGDTHICKSNKELVQWVLDNRFSNKTGIH